MVDHYWESHTPEVDPADAAEEEAMDLADELVSEGYVAEHPEMATYYPWADDDRHMFDPYDPTQDAADELARSAHVSPLTSIADSVPQDRRDKDYNSGGPN